MGWISAPELIIVLVIALLLFGAKRLPEIGKSLGTGMREFKNSVTGKDDEPAQLPPAEPVQTSATPPAAPEQTPTTTEQR
jgi:sec-independent protein translocase protein TatA